MEENPKIEVVVASEEHVKYVDEILDTINRAAKVRGTGIAKRSPEYVKQKMIERKAIVAICNGEFAGFSYIESWSNKEFVANSGLIVADKYRGIGLATRIKRRIFRLSREMYPDAELYLACGTDMFTTFDQWYRYRDIYQLATICAVARDDSLDKMKAFAKEQEKLGMKYLLSQAEPYVISSSDIRDMLRRGEDASAHLPNAVNEYISQNGLYR